jgi:ATP-dependent protease Clp ATPase subunit
MNEKENVPLSCSFCGKDSTQVKQLVAGGSGGFICDRCAWLSMVIVAKAKIAAALRFRSSSAAA